MVPVNRQPKKALVAKDTVYDTYGSHEVETSLLLVAGGKGNGSGTTGGAAGDFGATHTKYDVLGRPIGFTAGQKQRRKLHFRHLWHTGPRSSHCYQGLTTVATNDKGQTERKKEPNGQTVRITDATDAQLVHQHDAWQPGSHQDALQNVAL
jgi:hypothetical protein